MMGEASEAVAALHHARVGGAAAGCWEYGGTTTTRSSAEIGTSTASSGSSSSLFSSTSSLGDGEEDGDDGATSCSRPADPRRHLLSLSLSSLSSSTSSELEALQMNGPLYGMSTMRDHLPPALSRTGTGLSKYYKERSETFTSLADVSYLADLVKKTTAYVRRPKASRCHTHTATLGVKNRLSKTRKRAPSARKPAAYISECQGPRACNRELSRCWVTLAQMKQ